MPIEVRKALEILSEVLEGDKPARFFQQKRIALDGLKMEPSHFNHKLNGRQNFTKADYIRLAHYFELGEAGYKLFQEENEVTFRSTLGALGVGQYTKDPAQLLARSLSTVTNQSTAVLEFLDISSSRNNRSGLVSVENASQTAGATLRLGDCVRLQYRFSFSDETPLWFVLINIHDTSGSVRVLNPVFKESSIRLNSGQLNYPEQNFLEIRDVTLLGTHRLFALAATSGFLSTLQDETSRLLTIFNGSDGQETDNRFDGLLDRVALQNIEQVSRTSVIHCASLEYRQIYGAQQP